MGDPMADAVRERDAGETGKTGPEGAEQQGGRRAQRPFWQELPILVVVALVLALLLKTFLLQAFSIPSGSMQNTLQLGDRVLVDKLTPWFGAEPERGEVVVFHDPDGWLDEPLDDPNPLQTALGFIGLLPPDGEKNLIKRVVGVGGDTVECQDDGPLKVNGKALDEPYVFPGNTPCSSDGRGGRFKVTVPEGMLWMMGDHRQDSEDSRYHQDDENGGFVPVGAVVGRAVVVGWPVTRWATLPVPDAFDDVPAAPARR
ncbi:signal peptidase I [Streptomyces sp. NPDC093225]|uniref:signal peptidase I n=1 Tax=Streptomyces sp. NPDC093225 TaxID=3366034 RepID=UPI0038154B2A